MKKEIEAMTAGDIKKLIEAKEKEEGSLCHMKQVLEKKLDKVVNKLKKTKLENGKTLSWLFKDTLGLKAEKVILNEFLEVSFEMSYANTVEGERQADILSIISIYLKNKKKNGFFESFIDICFDQLDDHCLIEALVCNEPEVEKILEGRNQKIKELDVLVEKLASENGITKKDIYDRMSF